MFVSDDDLNVIIILM